MRSAYDVFKLFWNRHPALAYGLSTLLGIWSGLQWHWSVIPPTLVLILSTKFTQSCLLTLLFLCAHIHCITYYALPDLPDEGVAGTALITISRISENRSFLGSSYVLTGNLDLFAGAETVRGGHIKVSLPKTWNTSLPDPSHQYLIRGHLFSLGNGTYSLKTTRNTPWIKAGRKFDVTAWRYKAKKQTSDYLLNQFKNPKVGSFLVGLTTGEFSDIQTKNALADLGVQHLLAISGFHFALFASFLSLVFRTLFTRRLALSLLLIALTTYFLFLGYGPSIARAWLMVTLALTAELFELPFKSVNLLGIALLTILIWDPLSALDAGFQLSFLATGAILLLYPLLDKILSSWLPKHPLRNVVEMTGWDQKGYIILCLFRQTLALALSVNLTLLPVCLNLFHSYPLIAFITNLFYPFFAGISLTWLVLTLPIQCIIPPLARGMHAINNQFTGSLLDLAFHLPTPLQLQLKIDHLAPSLVTFYLLILVMSGILLTHKMRMKQSL